LRKWLPKSYTIVTKGRLLAYDGTPSPQVDIIVLGPAYPPFLVEKKVYLLGGVVAAFECKTTLLRKHLTTASQTCACIKGLPTAEVQEGSPWKELRGGVIYGLLAHSHDWRMPESTPKENVDAALLEDAKAISHPHELLDIVCISDLGCWHNMLSLSVPAIYGDYWQVARQHSKYPPDGGISGAFMGQHERAAGDLPLPAPIGVALASLYGRLGQTDPSMRHIADYLRMADIAGPGAGKEIIWPLSVLSHSLEQRLQRGQFEDASMPWGEWRPVFF
jgi:hypothetical protein